MVHDFPKCFKCWEDYCEFVNDHPHLDSVEIIAPLVLHCCFGDGKETIFDLHCILDHTFDDNEYALARIREALRNDPDLSAVEVSSGGIVFGSGGYGLSSGDVYFKGKEIKAPTKPPLS